MVKGSDRLVLSARLGDRAQPSAEISVAHRSGDTIYKEAGGDEGQDAELKIVCDQEPLIEDDWPVCSWEKALQTDL